ncbi:MAG TPA: SGNH hydrolase domain-containing protein, partial [Roseiarcus sp.]
AHALRFRLNILSAAKTNELPGEPGTLWPRVSQFLGDRKPDVVILAQRWSTKLADDGENHFGSTIASLVDRAADIIVLTQPPFAPANATRHEILAGARGPFFEDPIEAQNRKRANAIIEKFAGSRIRVVDVSDIFLDRDNSIRVIAPEGRLAYHDSTHLSGSGTRLVRGRLEQVLRKTLNLPETRSLGSQPYDMAPAP